MRLIVRVLYSFADGSTTEHKLEATNKLQQVYWIQKYHDRVSVVRDLPREA